MTVARGTTAVVCDPHEIANVLGAEGALWLLDAAEGSPLRVYAMAPSCVPGERPGVAARRAERGRHGADPRARARDRRRGGHGLPVGDRRRPGRPRQGRAPPARRRPRAGRGRPRARRLRRDRDRLRPRGHDLGGGAGEAPPRDLGAAARGLQRAQPRRAARARPPLRARVLRVLHGRPGAGRAAARRPHRRDVPDGGRARDRARGRAGDGLAARRALPRPRRPRARSRRATGPTWSCSTTSRASARRWSSPTAAWPRATA